MPLKRRTASPKKAAPKKKEAPKKEFKRKVKTEADGQAPVTLTMREAAMVAAYNTFKTAPLSIADISRVSGVNMTPARQESAEAHFDKFMQRPCKAIESYFEKKGLLDYLKEQVAPTKAFASDYEEDGDESCLQEE